MEMCPWQVADGPLTFLINKIKKRKVPNSVVDYEMNKKHVYPNFSTPKGLWKAKLDQHNHQRGHLTARLTCPRFKSWRT
uniref:Protein kinase domain-containing protein n=1 Tax=Globodera rostochiensis TaxID=31243 RepID=A0A914HJC8_GLORO